MLGSLVEADDAVQDAWLRLSRADESEIDNLGGWLTTVVARECLHMLRSRRRRQEDPFPPDPVVTSDGELDPEQEALLADSVGLAMLVVLERPADRRSTTGYWRGSEGRACRVCRWPPRRAAGCTPSHRCCRP
jgi:RNA polymerase sigma-70 factor (ECF subfamily)